eukprot:8952933-Pyramimonas_sp.AAC.1
MSCHASDSENLSRLPTQRRNGRSSASAWNVRGAGRATRRSQLEPLIPRRSRIREEKDGGGGAGGG